QPILGQKKNRNLSYNCRHLLAQPSLLGEAGLTLFQVTILSILALGCAVIYFLCTAHGLSKSTRKRWSSSVTDGSFTFMKPARSSADRKSTRLNSSNGS